MGLAISLAIHVVAIAVVSGWLGPATPRPARAAARVVVPPQGMRAIELAEAPAPAVPTPPRPVARPAPPRRTPAPVAAAPTPAEAPSRAPADTLTAAQRLAPRVVDPRLWEPMVIMPREPTLSDVEARISAAVELLSDSALEATERAIRARDWTVDDGKGGKWGISPGKLHLGKLTLPLPIWFPTRDPRETHAEQWYELDAQLDRALFLESFEARVKAIRERREKERAERQGTEAGNGG